MKARSIWLVGLATGLIAGCGDSGPSEPSAAANKSTAKVSDADGPLLKTEFDVKPTFGTYENKTEDKTWRLTVEKAGSCRVEEIGPEKPAVIVLQGKWEGTFDGIRCETTKYRGQAKAGELFFKVTPTGYEFKTSNQLPGLTLPKSFESAG